MADIEKRLISKIILTKDMATAIEAGVAPEWFTTTLNQKVFCWQQDYYREHRAVPTRDRLAEEYPEFRLLYKVSDPLTDCIDRLRRQRRLNVMQDGTLRAVTAMKAGDDERALDELSGAVRKVGAETAEVNEVDFQTTLAGHIEMLKGRANDTLVGLPTGFSALDQATRGLQPGELYSAIGLMKAGKSTLMMYVGQHLQELGVKPYYVNFEMPVGVQQSRYLALGAHVDYDRLEKGTLKRHEWRMVEDFEELARSWPARFIHCTDMQRSATVDGLEGLVVRNEPGILLVDGVYFMRDPETKQTGADWKAFTNITRGLKRMAQQLQLPIIVSHQATEGKTKKDPVHKGWRHLDMFSAAYGQSLAQDSDVMIGIEYDEDRPLERCIKIMASRHCAPGHATWVQWDWQAGYIGDHEGEGYDEDEDE